MRRSTPVSKKSALNSHGSRRRQIRTSAVAVTFDAAMKLDTSPAYVRAACQQSSGRFDGSTIVGLAVNMDGVGLKLANT